MKSIFLIQFSSFSGLGLGVILYYIFIYVLWSTSRKQSVFFWVYVLNSVHPFYQAWNLMWDQNSSMPQYYGLRLENSLSIVFGSGSYISDKHLFEVFELGLRPVFNFAYALLSRYGIQSVFIIESISLIQVSFFLAWDLVRFKN